MSPGRIRKLVQGIEYFEDLLLAVILLLMIALAFAQIVLRNMFDSGIVWGDSLLRIAVLWVALIGAMVASRSGNHINIDLVTRWVGIQARWIVTSISATFTIAICAVLAYHSYRFVQFEFEDGFTAFAAVPNWVCEFIMPLAFVVIALRYLAILVYCLRYRQPMEPDS